MAKTLEEELEEAIDLYAKLVEADYRRLEERLEAANRIIANQNRAFARIFGAKESIYDVL